MVNEMILSTFPKTWIFDLDGTILKHDGYKINGVDILLDGAKEYLNMIPEEDYILILTSRTDEYQDRTVRFLNDNEIRYDQILFNMPVGERIIVNDRKPSGINMAIAVNISRDKAVFPTYKCEL